MDMEVQLNTYQAYKGIKQVVKIVKLFPAEEFYCALILRKNESRISRWLPRKRFATLKEAQEYLDDSADHDGMPWCGINEKPVVFSGTQQNYDRVVE